MSPATATGFTVLIPARMASSRLPDKPLADIHGRPMIVHVWQRAMESGLGRVIVACSEQEVADAVTAAGGAAAPSRVSRKVLPRCEPRSCAAAF